jgi:hypothetical protein
LELDRLQSGILLAYIDAKVCKLRVRVVVSC